jgi:uncharacterized membrane protein YfcA
MMLPPIGLPALAVYARAPGGVPWSMVAAIAVGVTIGTAIGGRLAIRVPQTLATKVYGVALLGLAALMLAR